MLKLVPVRQRDVFQFIAQWHRHHKPPPGWLWGHGVVDDAVDDLLLGVAVVGRPVARMSDDGVTVEVTRVCTLGLPNCCSILYSAAWRAARAMGYARAQTYILEGEHGASLRAANWRRLASSAGGSWSRPSRERADPNPTEPKVKYGIGAWP